MHPWCNFTMDVWIFSGYYHSYDPCDICTSSKNKVLFEMDSCLYSRFTLIFAWNRCIHDATLPWMYGYWTYLNHCKQVLYPLIQWFLLVASHMLFWSGYIACYLDVKVLEKLVNKHFTMDVWIFRCMLVFLLGVLIKDLIDLWSIKSVLYALFQRDA